MNVIKHMALIIATGICIVTILEIVSFNLANQINFTYTLSNSVLLGCIGLIVVWSSKIFNANLWVYLFLFLLLASFTRFVSFSDNTYILVLFGLNINLLSLSLVITHLALHLEKFSTEKSTEEQLIDFEEKVNYFKTKFKSKTIEELTKKQKEKLLPEAHEAIIRLLNENN
jgi:hypothetical protein